MLGLTRIVVIRYAAGRPGSQHPPPRESRLPRFNQQPQRTKGRRAVNILPLVNCNEWDAVHSIHMGARIFYQPM